MDRRALHLRRVETNTTIVLIHLNLRRTSIVRSIICMDRIKINIQVKGQMLIQNRSGKWLKKTRTNIWIMNIWRARHSNTEDTIKVAIARTTIVE